MRFLIFVYIVIAGCSFSNGHAEYVQTVLAKDGFDCEQWKSDSLVTNLKLKDTMVGLILKNKSILLGLHLDEIEVVLGKPFYASSYKNLVAYYYLLERPCECSDSSIVALKPQFIHNGLDAYRLVVTFDKDNSVADVRTAF